MKQGSFLHRVRSILKDDASGKVSRQSLVYRKIEELQNFSEELFRIYR